MSGAEFVAALRAEYVDGVPGCVGQYFDKHGENKEYEKMEQQVQSSDDRQSAIDAFAKMLGADGRSLPPLTEVLGPDTSLESVLELLRERNSQPISDEHALPSCFWSQAHNSQMTQEIEERLTLGVEPSADELASSTLPPPRWLQPQEIAKVKRRDVDAKNALEPLAAKFKPTDPRGGQPDERNVLLPHTEGQWISKLEVVDWEKNDDFGRTVVPWLTFQQLESVDESLADAIWTPGTYEQPISLRSIFCQPFTKPSKEDLRRGLLQQQTLGWKYNINAENIIPDKEGTDCSDEEHGQLRVDFVATLIGATTTAIRNMTLKIEAPSFASGCATNIEKDLGSFNLQITSVTLKPGSARVAASAAPPTASGTLQLQFGSKVTPLMVKTPSFIIMFSSSVASVLNLAANTVTVKLDAGFKTGTNIGAEHEAPWTSSWDTDRDESDMPDLTDSQAIQESLFNPELFEEGTGYSKYDEEKRKENARRRKAWLWHWADLCIDEDPPPFFYSTGDDWRQYNNDERFYVFDRETPHWGA